MKRQIVPFNYSNLVKRSREGVGDISIFPNIGFDFSMPRIDTFMYLKIKQKVVKRAHKLLASARQS